MWGNKDLQDRICGLAHKLNYEPYTTTDGFWKAYREGKYEGWKLDVMANVKFMYDEVCCDRRIEPSDLRKLADIIEAIRAGFPEKEESEL